jgi:hypothetical protein
MSCGGSAMPFTVNWICVLAGAIAWPARATAAGGSKMRQINALGMLREKGLRRRWGICPTGGAIRPQRMIAGVPVI